MKTSFTIESPTRADLAGGTLDLWPLNCFLKNPKTINVALPLNAIVKFKVTKAKSFHLKIEAFNHEKIELDNFDSIEYAPGSLKFPLEIISRFIGHPENIPPLSIEIKINTEAPLRSGLGGSSTLCVALATGLNEIFKKFSKTNYEWDLLNWVKDLEAGFLKTPTGTQDYLAAIFGGFRCYSFSLGKILVKEYPINCYKELKENMAVIFSGEMHHSGMSNWEVFKGALENNSKIIQGLEGICELTNVLDRELSKKERDWSKIGALISEEWIIRKQAFNVNTPKLDEIVDFAKKQPIYGIKVCGAASGGSLLVLLPKKEKKAFSEACAKKNIQVIV